MVCRLCLEEILHISGGVLDGKRVYVMTLVGV